MKLPLLFTLILAPCLALAQSNSTDTPPPPPPPDAPADAPDRHGPDPDQQLAHLTAELKLTQAQQDRIKPILEDADRKRKAIMDNGDLTQKDARLQMRTLNQDTKKAIEEQLTGEQTTEFEKQHHRGGPDGGGPGGGGGAPPPQ